MGPELIKSCLFDKLRDAQKDEVDKMMADTPPGRPQVLNAGGDARRGQSRLVHQGQPQLLHQRQPQPRRLFGWCLPALQAVAAAYLDSAAAVRYAVPKWLASAPHARTPQPERLTRKEAAKQAKQRAAGVAASGDSGEAVTVGGGGAAATPAPAAEEQVRRARRAHQHGTAASAGCSALERRAGPASAAPLQAAGRTSRHLPRPGAPARCRR